MLKENISTLLDFLPESAKPFPLPKAFNSNKTANIHVSFSIYSGKKERSHPYPAVYVHWSMDQQNTGVTDAGKCSFAKG